MMTKPGAPDLETARCVIIVTTGVADFPDWRLLDQWLAAGSSLEDDIIPTIETLVRASRKRDPTWNPRTLALFDEAVREARKRRVMEPPTTTINPPIANGGERAATDPACTCNWCGVAFRPRGATGKRFCSDRCRAAFHRGCRVWAMRAVDEGRLSLEVIRDASKKPYTNPTGP
jgi:hypothetical protein